MHPIEAAVELGRRHGLDCVEPVVLKDGSNLIVHLAPAPVVVRVATLTGWVREDPHPYLDREVALTRELAASGTTVAPPSDLVPAGPHRIGGWWMSVTAWVDHRPGVIPTARQALVALDELHSALRRSRVTLPYLNPVLDDLDRAWRCAGRQNLIDEPGIRARRARRDELVRALDAAAPVTQPLHGDAFPRNALLGPDGSVTWIDLEDACLGPVAWDHAVLIRQGGDPALEPELRTRDGDEAIDAALGLRELQIEVWMLVHDARAAGTLPIPARFS